MKRFTRDSIHSHCSGAEWPDMLGNVDQRESFIIETERFNLVNGPVYVNGIAAGDAVAVTVENIELLPPYEAPNGGPLFEGIGDPLPLRYESGRFLFPRHFELQASPSVGNIAVLPERTDRIRELIRSDHGNRGWRRVVNDVRAKHCHQDCQYLGAGARIHLRAQHDGVGVCAADVHGYIGQGEIAFAGIEVNANVQLSVERSKGWLVDWPLIETQDEIMLFCSDTNLLDDTTDQEYVDVVREAYRAMREVVAAKIGGSIDDANSIVATALDVRNCALYGLGNFVQENGKVESTDEDIAVVASLRKDLFVE